MASAPTGAVLRASLGSEWYPGNMYREESDVVGELAVALRKRGIKIITSFHHAYNFQGYDIPTEGWDVAEAEYRELYGQLDADKAHERSFAKIKEVIDAYQPDQIGFDFGLDKIPDEYKRRMASYYYRQETKWGKDVIITRKGNHPPEGVGVLDIERGKMEDAAPYVWQADDSIATNSWCWLQNQQLKPAKEIVHELVDIVNKNGVLLLNVCPRADGTFPESQKELSGSTSPASTILCCEATTPSRGSTSAFGTWNLFLFGSDPHGTVVTENSVLVDLSNTAVPTNKGHERRAHGPFANKVCGKLIRSRSAKYTLQHCEKAGRNSL